MGHYLINKSNFLEVKNKTVKLNYYFKSAINSNYKII